MGRHNDTIERAKIEFAGRCGRDIKIGEAVVPACNRNGKSGWMLPAACSRFRGPKRMLLPGSCRSRWGAGMTAKALSRLAPKTLVPTGEGFGGFAKLEQCDIAQALCGLPQGQAALLRAIYSLDLGESNVRHAYLWAWQEAVNVAIENGWQPPKGKELLRLMSERIVNEFVFPQLTKCQHCHGTRAIQPNQHNPTGVCGHCTTGAHPNDDAEMAAMFDVSDEFWMSKGRLWFVRIYARLDEWRESGVRHVAWRLRDE